MKLFAYCGLVISVLWLNSATAQERTVTIGGNSSSLYFGPVQHFDINSQPITSFFTTSDGFTDRFPTNQVIGNSAFFSGELRTNDVDSYGADLATYSQSAGWTEYGSISAFLPTTDADGNGLPDICQTNRAVNLTGFQARSGTFHADSPFPRTDAFQLALSRASNQIAGTYTIKFSSEPVQASGVFQA